MPGPIKRQTFDPYSDPSIKPTPPPKKRRKLSHAEDKVSDAAIKALPRNPLPPAVFREPPNFQAQERLNRSPSPPQSPDNDPYAVPTTSLMSHQRNPSEGEPLT